MNTLRVCTLALTLFALGLCFGAQTPSLASGDSLAGADRVRTGELVVTNAAQNRFRLVGNDGTFQAPAGTSVEAFDGKPVQVGLSRDGRVLEITEMRVHIEPIVHGFDVVTGELVLRDAVVRTFALAGDGHIYIAPQGLDLRPFAGRIVDVRLDERGKVTEIEFAGRSADAPAVRSCLYDGRSYSEGASVCQSGTQFLCNRGEWRSLGSTCQP